MQHYHISKTHRNLKVGSVEEELLTNLEDWDP